MVITDVGVLRPSAEDHELELVSVHPGIEPDQVRAATGWELRVSEQLETTEPPTEVELRVLRDLKERTAQAHGGA